ncbi:MAG: hypothetical protein D3922_09715, partial [Candidatus Electrothrix sp. AR1]|nr:hypothetical protein [Candidatus Electrothrix sp. AR1]
GNPTGLPVSWSFLKKDLVTTQGDMVNCSFCLGGLTVNTENRIEHSLLLDGAPEYASFLCSAASSDADIQITMKNSSDSFGMTAGNSLFSADNLEVRTCEDGYQILRYWSEKQRPFASILTDNSFCQFDYCFYPDAIPVPKSRVVDPWKAAIDAVLFQHIFINHSGVIIHAGGGSVQGKGMIFAGTSGAGKSTLSELLCSSPDNQLFSDERLVIRFSDHKWNIWGTPWQGTGNIARNETAPLSALVFLKQAERTKINELTPSQGLHRLLQVVSIPWYSEKWTNKGLAVCEPLIQDIPMFELAFRADETAVQAVEELASGLP